ncbi:MAG TPA: hypothetical protein VIU65_12380 [Pyrinomonadaceae bacterium]
MKRTLISTAAVFALLAVTSLAFGDLARPKPSPAQAKPVLYTRLEVKPETQVYEARLQISEETLKQIARSAADGASTTSITQRLMHSSSRTMIAGLFMFLSVSFAGVWFARSAQRRNHKVIVAIVGLAACLGLATIMVRANAGPSGLYYWQHLGNNLNNGKTTDGGVSIEVVPGDDSVIRLVIPVKKKGGSEE